MYQLVGGLQIGNSVVINVGAEITVIAGKFGAQAMIQIQHARDAVKTESVKVHVFHPESQIA